MYFPSEEQFCVLHSNAVWFLFERGVFSVAPCGKGVFDLNGL